MPIFPEGMFSGTGSVGSYLSAFKTIAIGIFILVIVVGVAGTIIWRRKAAKRYNIPLIIITPRSDGRVVEINSGYGGYFKSKRVGGISSFKIKRKGIGVVEIPPPPSSYLTSPNRTLILAQKGVDDYEPVMPDNLAYVNTEDGETNVPILKLRAINQDATAWQCDNAESAKKRFTLWSLWEKYQVMITLMTFVFILFIIMYINWIGMKDVIVGLKEVADALRTTTAPIITPGG